MQRAASHTAPLCLMVLFVSQISAQVIAKSNAGLTTPEGILISNADQTTESPFYNLSFLSAQVVDVNGKLDLVAGTYGPPVDNLQLRNAGNQNFQLSFITDFSYCQPYYTLRASAGLDFCALLDVNGDGLPDRIFATQTTNTATPPESDNPLISVELNIGSGLYSTQQNYGVGGAKSYISSVTSGDFNGDGQTDLAVLVMPQTPAPGTGLYFGQIVLLNQDRGNFKAAAPVNSGVFGLAPAGQSLKIAALDLNGDGISDLIVYGGVGDSYISVFNGTRGGLSGQPQITAFIDATFQIQFAGDLNHDGYGDLVVIEDDGVHVLLGGPGGTIHGYFASDQKLIPSDIFNSTTGVVAGDFDGDGLPDLAVATNNEVTIFVQRSKGSFKRLQQYAGGGLITVGDIDGDGNLDLAVGGNPVNIFYGQGNGYFHGSAVTANHGVPSAVAVADFNHDGIPDVATTWMGTCKGTGCTNMNVSIFLGSGHGWFLPPVSYHLPLSNHQVGAFLVAAGDLNHDGNLDLVAYNPFQSTGINGAVLLGKADGTFATAKAYAFGLGPNGPLSLRDMDHDGKLDLVGNIGVAYGKGDGTFTAVAPFPGQPAEGIAIADVNHDGRLDVLASNGADVRVLLGAAGRTFTTGQIITLPCTPSCASGGVSLAAGDLNGDGEPDFVALATGEMFTYLGNGAGMFAEKQHAAVASLSPFPQPNEPVAIEDLNGDGNNDVVVTLEEGLMPVYLGKGDGRVSAPILFPVSGGAIHAAPAFAHLIADKGLAVMMPAGSGFARLMNTGAGSWPAVSKLAVAPVP